MTKHRFQRGGRIFDQLCGKCNAAADADIHQMGDIERAAQSTQPAPEPGGEWLARGVWIWHGTKTAAIADSPVVAARIVSDLNAVSLLVVALKALDDYYQASGKVWDDARAALAAVGREEEERNA